MVTTVTPARGLRAIRRLGPPRVSVRRIGVLVALGLILFVAWLVIRTSSLVAITRVQFTGLSGADTGQIRTALTDEALTMTTMDVSTAKLEGAISGFAHIAGVRVSTHFPHGVTIDVEEQIPVATVSVGGRQVDVDGAGLLLPKDSTAGIPALPLAGDPGANRVTAGATLTALQVLATAPFELLAHIASARSTLKHGVAVQLRDGPVLYFGDGTQLNAKWAAVEGVLADTDSAGAVYIDVSAPARPAAGTSEK